MAARGAQCKEQIKNKLLEIFEGSFVNDKEIRIPMEEDGSPIQIKVTLTAAKDLIDTNPTIPSSSDAPTAASEDNFMTEPTQEERATVEDLMSRLGL